MHNVTTTIVLIAKAGSKARMIAAGFQHTLNETIVYISLNSNIKPTVNYRHGLRT